MSTIRNLIASLLGNWQFAAVIFAVGLAMGTATTWRVMSWREDAAEGRAAVVTLEYVKGSAAITYDVGAELAKQYEGINANTITLIREVPRYVSVADREHCIVSRGFVELFNYSAENTIPTGHPGDDAASPSSTSCADVLNTIVLQNAVYFRTRAQVIAWQDWYVKQQALAETVP